MLNSTVSRLHSGGDANICLSAFNDRLYDVEGIADVSFNRGRNSRVGSVFLQLVRVALGSDVHHSVCFTPLHFT